MEHNNKQHHPNNNQSNKMTTESNSPAAAAVASSKPKDEPPQQQPQQQDAKKQLPTVDQARSALDAMVHDDTEQEDLRNCLSVVLQDHEALKDKIGKLKSLLGRSAKAQREAKVELETTQKRLTESQNQVSHLTQKVDKLATRPTHMELLADFETNFDRALLSVAPQQQQSGGESTAGVPPPSSSPTASNKSNPRASVTSVASAASTAHNNDGSAELDSSSAFLMMESESAVVDGLLMQELQDSKARCTKLESLNAALLVRSSQLEAETKDRRRERDELQTQVSHLELEKRMLQLEAEHASKLGQEKAAQVSEMQLEIDLLAQSSAKAVRRAQKDEQLLKSVKTDQKYVAQLEGQVQALQEWATAAAQAKTLSQERVRLLEAQVRSLQQSTVTAKSKNAKPEGDTEASDASPKHKVLWERQGSLVIGAGDWGVRVLECDSTIIPRTQRVVLKWQFDLLHSTASSQKPELTVDFSVFQGRCESKESRKTALQGNRALIDNRVVQGGGAGELDNAFFYQDACTLLWSNVKSWIRPRTVRYTVQAVAVDNPSVLLQHQMSSFASTGPSSNVAAQETKDTTVGDNNDKVDLDGFEDWDE